MLDCLSLSIACIPQRLVGSIPVVPVMPVNPVVIVFTLHCVAGLNATSTAMSISKSKSSQSVNRPITTANYMPMKIINGSGHQR
jgi:hypothetical protein